MRDILVIPEKSGLVIRVGGPEADIKGFDSKAIQLAIDLAASQGSGTVKLEKGVFHISAPIRLKSGINLAGSGDETVLHKMDGHMSYFVEDADYGELKITVDDASSFRTGMGVQIFDSAYSRGWGPTTAVILEVDKNNIYIDNYLVQDYMVNNRGLVSSNCSIIECVGAGNIRISDLSIDGNKDKNHERLGGCRGGAIYIHKAYSCTIENVKIKDFNGDGLSWQITRDITVRNCEISGCTFIGMHPGTGSLRSVVEGNKAWNNGFDGLFVCWRVQQGIFMNNRLHNNAGHGINIGHKDTDNLFEGNHIYENGISGIYIRVEEERNGAHRNIYRNNIIENNGDGQKGYGILIDGFTIGVRILDNTIMDSGAGAQKVGIQVNVEITEAWIENNEFSGHTDGNVVYCTGRNNLFDNPICEE